MNSEAPVPEKRRKSFLENLDCVEEIPSKASVFSSGDLYVNNRFGFAFRKPSSWRFEHLSTFADLRNEYDFASANAEQIEILQSGSLPLAVISQARLLSTLCSSMTIYAELNPFSEYECVLDAMPDVIKGTSSFIEHFKVVLPARAVSVSGAEAVEYAATFFYRDNLGNSGPARHRSLIVLREQYLYTLNMIDMPADGIFAENEFNQIRKSIVFA